MTSRNCALAEAVCLILKRTRRVTQGCIHRLLQALQIGVKAAAIVITHLRLVDDYNYLIPIKSYHFII